MRSPSIVAAITCFAPVLLAALFALSACGPSAPAPVRTDHLAQTTAGKNRCVVAQSHDRPFIIEWDATDRAEFEAKVKRDLVVVRYEGCEMQILYGCSDDALPGRYGAYAAAQATSGNVEGFDIRDETELYARLPLGAASLEGRVRAGEALHLKYYVSGVVTSARDAVYQGELEGNPRCKGATHFVASFALGAFELDSSARTSAAGGASFAGAGAGGGRANEQSTVKRGGDIASCNKDSAVEASACRVPIRLSLRAIEPGGRAAPATVASGAPSTADARLDATQMRKAAREKFEGGDGAGCLADLDRAAALDPNVDAATEALRATCEMRAGKCDSGRRRLRAAVEAMTPVEQRTPAHVDRVVDSEARRNCSVDQLTSSELAMKLALSISQSCRKDSAAAMDSARKLAALLEKADTPAALRKRWEPQVLDGAACAAQIGRCDDARALFDAHARIHALNGDAQPDPRRALVSGYVSGCRPK